MLNALLLALSLWVTQATGLPLPAKLPTLHIVTERSLCAIVEAKKSCENLRALYMEGGIYVRTSFDPTTLKDMSLLVHELVHHHQEVNGVTYACTGQAEPLAYRTQVRWLMEAGVKDPWGLIETTEFTVLTYAICGE